MENNTGKLPLRRYFSQTRGGILESLTFRTGLFLNLLGNMVYMVVMFFLWRAIYASSPAAIVGGMTFQDTLVYLTMAGAIFSTLEVYLVWKMGRDIQSGQISLYFTKPMDFFLREFFYVSGNVIVQLFLTLIPTFFIVCIFTGWMIPIGWNLPVFMVSIFLSLLLNFSFDFIVGTLCLYTQSFWGINMVKEVIILLLSGATVPIAFFPETFRTVVLYLPFQAMYNVPLQILISHTYTWVDYAGSLGVQLFWVVILVVIGRLFFKRSSRIITVNGG
jgi:ABC-2 type transport system permease protein